MTIEYLVNHTFVSQNGEHASCESYKGMRMLHILPILCPYQEYKSWTRPTVDTAEEYLSPSRSPTAMIPKMLEQARLYQPQAFGSPFRGAVVARWDENNAPAAFQQHLRCCRFSMGDNLPEATPGVDNVCLCVRT